MKRAALGVVVALLALLVALAPAAFAHTDLVASTPDDGAHLATVPKDVALTFSEDLLPDTVVVSVEDATGFVVRVLDLTVDGSDVTLSFPPGMHGTDFTVNYRVVSQDGHPVSGSIAFTVDTPPDAPSPVAASAAPIPATSDEPSAVSSEGDQPSSAIAPIAAISAGLGVGIAAGFVIYLFRRHRPDAS